ncbi:MAG TPA: glycogen/starch synthase [Bacteroidales bacterium]|nr:glycogen/starch synthase [Bacteroidales bacterium]HPE57820.1 glycogen/starch synthase [Bacteroidales bacterium]HRX97298.1 glycogen/starch synthase [Bacteroidales bacterium]
MEKAKVLFIAQEIIPYLPESHMGTICRYLPQGTQESGREIRTFMPRFGNINERRNQLHEVIRLSGMNLIIDDNDHPLIIKVASIQQARMQVYFIDNEDYFHRKYTTADKANKFYDDNDERAIFFSRGVLETVKKLGWPPDVVHCHGWMSSLVPIYIKKAFKDNPLFSDTKIICSIYNDDFTEMLSADFAKKVKLDGITNKDLNHYQSGSYENVMKGAIDNSDAIILGDEQINSEVLRYLKESKKPMLEYQPMDTYIKAYNEFYDQVMGVSK